MFKKSLISLIFLVLFAPVGQAQWSAQALLGMERGDMNFGLDVDYNSAPGQSVGGFLLMGDRGDGAFEFWSLGVDAKVFFGPKRWRLYLAPGLGITSFDLPNGNSETTFGTVFKVGALHRITKGFSFGLEYLIFTNWFTDAPLVPGGFQMVNAVFRFEF